MYYEYPFFFSITMSIAIITHGNAKTIPSINSANTDENE
jgi:hypothetical protein